ncbi:MAG: DUF4097 family beta strand repeat protein [Fidelibacterota bacterium]|nr:MAG: DUF4097 family beta strand repeat protein [Candidatus Neomarinimicrobiota bacterium]
MNISTGQVVLAAVLLWSHLPGQELPQLPEIPEAPQLRDYHGKYQGVVVHRIDVEPEATLIMQSLKGDVVLIGTDVNRIVIEEKITVKTRHRDHAHQTIQEVLGKLSPPTSSGEPYIFKMTNWSGRDVWYDFKVRVPRTFNIIIKSYGGDIDLSDLQGDLEAKTGGGDIALSNSIGKIMVKTGGGDIDVFKVEGQVDLLTSGGDIEGRSVQGKLTVVTGGGDIDFWHSKGSFTLNTGGGDIELQSFEGTELEARTGAGEINATDVTAQINFMTSGGDICAEDINGYLEVATSGGDLCLEGLIGDAVLYTGSGDVEICKVTGSLKVKSGSGDISVCDMTLEEPGKDESTFSTSHGNVYVSFNTDKPVDIQAKIMAYTPRYGIEHIRGNVDLSYRKENGGTLGTYQTDQPFHRIVIETQEGEITIMKGEE